MKKWIAMAAIVVCAMAVGKMTYAEDSLSGGKSTDGQGTHGKHGDRFAKADTNGDGKISFEEFKARAAAHMARKQGKGDGKGQPSAERLQKKFDRIDANKDGFLSKEEIAVAIKKHKKHGKKGGKGSKDKASSTV